MNDAGGESAVSTTVVADSTPPVVTGRVMDGHDGDDDCVVATGTLSASWQGVFSDRESGLLAFEWAVGSCECCDDLVPFTRLDRLVEHATLEDARFSESEFVYSTVRAVNGAGMTATSCSDGVRILPSTRREFLCISSSRMRA